MRINVHKRRVNICLSNITAFRVVDTEYFWYERFKREVICHDSLKLGILGVHRKLTTEKLIVICDNTILFFSCIFRKCSSSPYSDYFFLSFRVSWHTRLYKYVKVIISRRKHYELDFVNSVKRNIQIVTYVLDCITVIHFIRSVVIGRHRLWWNYAKLNCQRGLVYDDDFRSSLKDIYPYYHGFSTQNLIFLFFWQSSKSNNNNNGIVKHIFFLELYQQLLQSTSGNFYMTSYQHTSSQEKYIGQEHDYDRKKIRCTGSKIVFLKQTILLLDSAIIHFWYSLKYLSNLNLCYICDIVISLYIHKLRSYPWNMIVILY